MNNPASEICPGRAGAYQLQARIGVGGTAEVWRALHRIDGRVVAMKLVTSSRRDNEEDVTKPGATT